MTTRNHIRIALIGCGAVTELYYAPALAALQFSENLEVVALVDPNAERRGVIRKVFPQTKEYDNLANLPPGAVEAAIVASPARFHSAQTIDLLNRGIHVLCEKPMATSLSEAENMISAANANRRILGVGLFRRFFPTSRHVKEILQSKALGNPLSWVWMEGAPFNWPSATASFFRKETSSGGVLADLGVHALDLLLWWFGEPSHFHYEDDSRGGLEANCRLSLEYPSGVTGKLRLSRDTVIPNHVLLSFERGWLRMDGSQATQITIGLKGVAMPMQAELQVLENPSSPTSSMHRAQSLSQSFGMQISNFARAIRGEEKLFIPGEEGIRSQRWLEAFYFAKQEMPQPWL